MTQPSSLSTGFPLILTLLLGPTIGLVFKIFLFIFRGWSAFNVIRGAPVLGAIAVDKAEELHCLEAKRFFNFWPFLEYSEKNIIWIQFQQKVAGGVKRDEQDRHFRITSFRQRLKFRLCHESVRGT